MDAEGQVRGLNISGCLPHKHNHTQRENGRATWFSVGHLNWILCFLRAVACFTLTSHLVRYTFLILAWASFCLENCPNSLRQIFNKVLERFLRDFGPC